jgi:DNA-binding CsgD family transcriptional regulator
MKIDKETKYQQDVERMYFSGHPINDIAFKYGISRHTVKQTISMIIERRKADRVSPEAEMAHLEENLFYHIKEEQKNPTIINKRIVDNLQDIYAKKLMYV